MKSPGTACLSTPLKRYMLFYNGAMCFGWFLILLRISAKLVLLRNHTDKFELAYNAVETLLKIFQTGAVFEVIHALTGIVRAPVSTTGLQVSSRLMLLWGITASVPQSRNSFFIASMIVSWSLTEIPRYAYFAVSAVNGFAPHWLVWLRYSTFILLYPSGAGSECGLMFNSLSFIRSSKLYSVTMPNWANFAFDYYIFCVITLAMYVPGLPHMYFHMLRQRSRHLKQSSHDSILVKIQ